MGLRGFVKRSLYLPAPFPSHRQHPPQGEGLGLCNAKQEQGGRTRGREEGEGQGRREGRSEEEGGGDQREGRGRGGGVGEGRRAGRRKKLPPPRKTLFPWKCTLAGAR